MPAGFAKRIGQPHRTRGDPVIVPQDDIFLRKEVIQPQVPLRLPCYDLVPITELAVDASLLDGWVGGFGHSRLSWLDGRCVQGSGTYSPRRADPRLLAIPASCRRIAACNPN